MRVCNSGKHQRQCFCYMYIVQPQCLDASRPSFAKEKRAHASWCRRVTDVVHLARVPSMERRRLLTCLLACLRGRGARVHEHSKVHGCSMARQSSLQCGSIDVTYLQLHRKSVKGSSTHEPMPPCFCQLCTILLLDSW